MKYVLLFCLLSIPAFAQDKNDNDYVSGYTQGYIGAADPERDGTLYGSGYDDGVRAMHREQKSDQGLTTYDPQPHYNSFPEYNPLPDYMR